MITIKYFIENNEYMRFYQNVKNIYKTNCEKREILVQDSFPKFKLRE